MNTQCVYLCVKPVVLVLVEVCTLPSGNLDVNPSSQEFMMMQGGSHELSIWPWGSWAEQLLNKQEKLSPSWAFPGEKVDK